MKKHILTLVAASLIASSAFAGTAVCDAGKYTLCPAEELKAEGSELDHVDLLGYSGMAFRVHALPRMMFCRSTVVCRYGFKPGMIKEGTDAESAIRLAAQLVGTQTFGEYVSGQAAYVLWISLLEAADDSKFMKRQLKGHEGDGGLARLNADCYRALIHARSAAAPFLKRRAEALTGNQKRAVLAAADNYQEVVTVLKSVGNASWEPVDRTRQAGALRRAMELEATAGELLTRAMGTE
jgi:hypothetical protein